MNAVIRNSYFGGNAGAGVLIQLMNLEEDSIPVSITIEDSVIERNTLNLSIVGTHHHPPGTITIRNTPVGGLRWVRPGDNLEVSVE